MLKGSARSYLELDNAALLKQCDVHTYRSRGPGGQKRNKTSSAVRVRHRPTGLTATATEDRSQHVNKARAVRRLRNAIALHVRTEVGPDHYEVSALLSGCIGDDGHILIGRRDSRYCLVISEILDIVFACGMRLREAAGHLQVPTSHLVNLFQRDPKLWERVNEMRIAAGLKRLR
ncbi:MAG: peptide chain release factor family protein [Phycisphaerae bacterium]